MSQIPGRLTALREAMREHGVTHYLVPSSDEHAAPRRTIIRGNKLRNSAAA